MNGSVYKIIEVVGSSQDSWEQAAQTAIRTAGKRLKELRVAEVVKLDMKISDGKVISYRARLNLSFKYEPE